MGLSHLKVFFKLIFCSQAPGTISFTNALKYQISSILFSFLSAYKPAHLILSSFISSDNFQKALITNNIHH